MLYVREAVSKNKGIEKRHIPFGNVPFYAMSPYVYYISPYHRYVLHFYKIFVSVTVLDRKDDII